MPRGPTLPLKTMAALLDLTERRLQQLAAEGWIPRPDRGHYSLRDSVRGYIRYLKQHSRQQGRGNEHAGLARAQRHKVELENFKRMGELQVTAQVDETCHGLIGTLKANVEGLPGRLSSELADKQAPHIYQRLQVELKSVLTVCADYLEKRADALGTLSEPLEDSEAEREADPDDLGESQSGHAAG